ncbi:MAG TPA: acyl carrier protein [Clostridiales bacterium]|jgi:acyl carrier protein|nr:acyl carrier protein [Clostridiales bacterium]
MTSFEEIRKLFSEELGIPENKISLETKIVDDLGADSINMMEIASIIEERYSIEIPEEMLANMKTLTVGEIVNAIDKLKG